MGERDWLAERFEEQRTRLRAVAYRMLGSLSEADDAVQEAWLRLGRTDASEIENLGGWLTTVVARVSLNMLRSRNVRGEEPLGVRMPDPIVDSSEGTDPEHEALLADSVGLALLVAVLDPDVVVRADFGPARGSRETRGAAAVARQALGFARLGLDVRPALINGIPGAVAFRHGQPFSIGAVTVRNGRIVELDFLNDPERLRLLDLTILD